LAAGRIGRRNRRETGAFMSALRVKTAILAAILASASLASSSADDAQTPAALSAPSPAAVITYRSPVLAITHVRVLDGTGSAPREDQTVVISHGKIARVGAFGRIPVPASAQIIDGRGETLTPGFVGTHDHLYYVSGGPLFIMREMPYSFPRLYLAAGVTTIRTAGDVEPYTDLRVKRAIDSGVLAGPNIDVTSPYMTGFEPFFIQMGTLRDAADARRTVDYWADRGVTSFKLYINLPVAVARAVIAAAHARHLRVLGHLCSIGMRQAAEMGLDSFEHGLLIDTEFMPGKRPGVCPTDAKAVRESIAALDVRGPQVRSLIASLLRHHVAISSTLANFEGGVPPPMSVEERMFSVEDAGSRDDVLKARARSLARPAAARAPGPSSAARRWHARRRRRRRRSRA